MRQPQVYPDLSARLGKRVIPGLDDEAGVVPPGRVQITVTDDGSDGRPRDQVTATSPIFGSRSFPPAVIAKQALRVNRISTTALPAAPWTSPWP